MNPYNKDGDSFAQAAYWGFDAGYKEAVKDLEARNKELEEKLETSNFWNQLRETHEKLKIAIEALEKIENGNGCEENHDTFAMDTLDKLKRD